MTTQTASKFAPGDRVEWDPDHLAVPNHPKGTHGNGPFTVVVVQDATHTAQVHPQLLVLEDEAGNTVMDDRADDAVLFTAMWFAKI